MAIGLFACTLCHVSRGRDTDGTLWCLAVVLVGPVGVVPRCWPIVPDVVAQDGLCGCWIVCGYFVSGIFQGR